MFTSATDPIHDCALCPRLQGFRDGCRDRQPLWHNAPVPSFGASDARLLIVGLAPGLNGANRTGRPFTGDFAGDLLYATLLKVGFARGTYGAAVDDGLILVDCRITNAVRCVPPQNKPTPSEIAQCRPFLTATIAAMPRLQAILALGRIAHDSMLASFGARKVTHPFKHGAVHTISPGLSMYDSYHCSRYNTNTGVLTPRMFEEVLLTMRTQLNNSNV